MRTLATALTLLLALMACAGQAHAFELSALDPERELITLGGWAPLAIVGLRFAAALSGVIPSSPVLLAAGATQGIVLGSVYVLIGAQLGALVAFLIGRRLGRRYVARKGWMDSLARTKFGGWLLDEKASQGRLMAAVFYCRLIPGINLDALSYVAGVTPIATWRFCLATFGALLPYTLLLVGLGKQLVRLGPNGEIIAVLAILAVAAVPVLWRLFRARTVES